MHENDVRKAETAELVKFLDAGKGVDGPHIRNALANLAERIARLERGERPKGSQIDELYK